MEKGKETMNITETLFCIYIGFLLGALFTGAYLGKDDKK